MTTGQRKWEEFLATTEVKDVVVGIMGAYDTRWDIQTEERWDVESV
jgi:hypothetical protein